MADPMPAPSQLTGECMCGAVSFGVSAPLIGALYCHCKRCQRRTGTAFSVSGLTQMGSFEITQGEEEVTTYDPGDGGWKKSFCSHCGGQLFTSNPDGMDLPAGQQVIAVRLGALDQDPGIRPVAHQFTDYAAPWEPIPDDGLPRYPERADWGKVLAAETDQPSD
jgi:hypothetical protein